MDIAARLIDEGNVGLGIQLLDALCEEKTLPHEMAERHLRLSQTLLEHTHNLNRAKDHALKARAAVMSLRDGFVIKCRTLLHLGHCCYLAKERRHQIQCYRKGLEICQDTDLSSVNRIERNEWHCCFAVGLFRAAAADGNSAVALESLQQAEKAAGECGLEDYEVWIPIVRSLQSLHDGDISATESALCDLTSRLSRTANPLSPDLRKAGHLYRSLIASTLVLQTGDHSTFVQKSIVVSMNTDASLPDEMHHCLQLLSSGDWLDPFRWLSLKEIRCALLSNFATILLQRGQMDQSAQLLDTSQLLSNSPLAPDLLESETERETVFEFAALEIKTRQNLLSNRLSQAQDTLSELLARFERHPTLFVQLKAPMHCLIGCYLQCMGLHKLAAAHYRRSLSHLEGSWLKRGSLLAAFAEIVSRSRNGLSRALGLMDSFKNDTTTAHSENALFFLVSGLISEVQGNSLEARHHLRKALEKTEEEDMPLELVGHICLLSGQIQLDEGIAGPVRGVLDRARRCFECQGDLAMTLKATNVLQQSWAAAEKDISENERIDRKQAGIKEAIRGALAKDAHKAILKWDLAT